MKINGDLLFYWIHRKYPKAIYISDKKITNGCQVKGPMFWSTTAAMAGHLVVVEAEMAKQIVQGRKNAIFLCIGGDEKLLKNSKNECILLQETLEKEQVFNYLLEIFGLFEQWEARLRQAVAVFFSYDAIIRSCDSMLEDPLALTDEQFHYVGFSRQLAHEIGFDDKYGTKMLPLDTINILTSLPEHKKLNEIREVYLHVGVENMRHKNIFYGDDYIGKLSIFNKKDPILNAYYSQILCIVGDYIEKLYAKLGTFWHRKSSDTKIKMLIYNLMGGAMVDVQMIYERAGRLGHCKGDKYCLIQIKSHFSKDRDKLNTVLSAHLEDMWIGSLGLIFREQFYILINLTEFARRTGKSLKGKNGELAVFLRESRLIAGVSRVFLDLSHLPIAVKQSEIALDLGEQQDPSYWYFNFDDYALQYLLYKGCQDFLPEDIIAQELLLLMEYDQKNETSLVETLGIYQKNMYNAVAAAAELCIARSTFLNRLNRIEKITGIDIKCHEMRLYLALSYTLIDQFKKC